MRASSSTVALVLLCLRGARSAMAPAASSYRAAGARAGVIGQLFPAVAQQLQPLLRWPLQPSFRAKKQAALRWRTAQARSIVERCTREIKALEAKLKTCREEVAALDEAALADVFAALESDRLQWRELAARSAVRGL